MVGEAVYTLKSGLLLMPMLCSEKMSIRGTDGQTNEGRTKDKQNQTKPREHSRVLVEHL